MTRYPYTFGLLSVVGTITAFIVMVTSAGWCGDAWRMSLGWLLLLASLPGWVIPAADAVARHLGDFPEGSGQ